MVSFLGSYEYSFDGKGRVVLPVAFRDEFAAGGVALARKEHLALYPREAWFGTPGTPGTLDKLRSLLAEGRLSRDQLNTILSYAVEVKPDSQGRITIPGRVRVAGTIDHDKVLVVGADDYVAIRPGENIVEDVIDFQSTVELLDGMGV